MIELSQYKKGLDMTSASQEIIINGRYKLLTTLGEGGMGIVNRCLDRLTGDELAIKRVRTSVDWSQEVTLNEAETHNPVPGTMLHDLSTDGDIRLALSNEFQTLASLRHPHIISVMDYGFDNKRQPFFTMPLIDTPQTITERAKTLSFKEKLNLVGEMMQAVAYLHQRDIIHRDLKPDNVLVTADNRVKVLDFGLAVVRRKHENDEMITGTIPYMAPEVLAGDSVSFASDLWAIGMIMYEVLTGEYPYPKDNMPALIASIMTGALDVHKLDLSTGLIVVLDNLLAYDVENRYQDAIEALENLIDATEGDIAVESDEVRDSILKSASFVGRDEELQTLTHSLIQSTRSHGVSWLIGGESGVGKSRLIDELRTYALINGVTVLRGQAVSGSENAFAVWRDPLRRLLLTTDIEPQEASILKTLIQDIDQLVGHEVEAVADADENTNYIDQLTSLITKIFREQGAPVMLILEDLQWAGDSLDVLKALNSIAPNLRLFIIGTYRSDENATLHEALPAMEHSVLKRFTRAEIARLTSSMLGTPEKDNEALVNLLARETEGNVLFVIEVLRSLAQDAGYLGQVSSMTLPKEVTAGGIQEILRKRLTRLSDNDLQLLRYASIAGREVDVKLLDKLAETLPTDFSVEDWLARCLNRGVFTLQNTVWRFSHDRLRVLVIESETTASMQGLHTSVAEAIEQVYKDSPQHYRTLQMHWHNAGDLGRELRYAVAAGDYAMQLNTFDDAIESYSRAVAIAQQNENYLLFMSLSRLMFKLGKAQYNGNQYTEGRDTLLEGIDLMETLGNLQDYADAKIWLSYCYWRLGDYDTAEDAANDTLILAQGHGYDLLMIDAYGRLGQIAIEQGDIPQAKAHWQAGLEIGEAYPQSEQIAPLLNGMGQIAGQEGDFDEALVNFEKTIDIYKQKGALHRVVIAMMNVGIVYYLRGDVQDGIAYLEETLALAREIGDQSAIASVLSNLGFMAQTIEDYDKARDYLTESLSLAQTMNNRSSIVMAIINLGHLEAKVGDTVTTRAYFRSGLREAYEINLVPHMMEILTELARIEEDADRQLQWLGFVLANDATKQDARETAEQALETITNGNPDHTQAGQIDIGENLSLEQIVTDILGIV